MLLELAIIFAHAPWDVQATLALMLLWHAAGIEYLWQMRRIAKGKK